MKEKIVSIREAEKALNARIAALETDKARLEKWVSDLQSGMFVNCVYCGHRYGPADNVPVTMAEALKEHVEQCPAHPYFHMRKALIQCVLVLRKWLGSVVFDTYYHRSPLLRLVREAVPWEEIQEKISEEERAQ